MGAEARVGMGTRKGSFEVCNLGAGVGEWMGEIILLHLFGIFSGSAKASRVII